MSRPNIYPSREYLQECFRYEDGKLYWLKRPLIHFKNEHGYKIWNSSHPGEEAGALNTNSTGIRRCVISINKILYYRSNLVWILFNGGSLENNVEINHNDNNTLNDRIENLSMKRISKR